MPRLKALLPQPFARHTGRCADCIYAKHAFRTLSLGAPHALGHSGAVPRCSAACSCSYAEGQSGYAWGSSACSWLLVAMAPWLVFRGHSTALANSTCHVAAAASSRRSYTNTNTRGAAIRGGGAHGACTPRPHDRTWLTRMAGAASLTVRRQAVGWAWLGWALLLVAIGGAAQPCAPVRVRLHQQPHRSEQPHAIAAPCAIRWPCVKRKRELAVRYARHADSYDSDSTCEQAVHEAARHSQPARVRGCGLSRALKVATVAALASVRRRPCLCDLGNWRPRARPRHLLAWLLRKGACYRLRGGLLSGRTGGFPTRCRTWP